MDRFNVDISPEILQSVEPDFRGVRIAPDVSVLLAGILDPGSYSNQCLALLNAGTVVLGAHVEDMALRVVRANAPNLVGDLADGLIHLAVHTKLDRTLTADPSSLPSWTTGLSSEDRQVLAETVAGKADVLLTHDSKFFIDSMPGLRVDSPSSFLWAANDPRNVEVDPFAWTFLGLFWPQWGSKVMRGSRQEFYMLDIPGKAEFYFDTSSESFVLKWYENGAAAGQLVLPQVVVRNNVHFVAAAVDESGIMLFSNGEARQRQARIGPVPQGSKLYPFNNSRGGGQISGGMRFRMAKGRLAERRIRRLWRSRSLRLSDGELRFQDLVSTTRSKMEGQGRTD